MVNKPSTQEQALSMHNDYRRKHQAPDFRWNNELADAAQVWAEKIANQKSTLQLQLHATTEDGENIMIFPQDK